MLNDSTLSRPYFSIVIPVYEGEGFVRAAIDSVLRQSIGLDSLEIIVVDDGSTDATAEIVDGIAHRFPWHVKVIHQENEGVSSALNAGVGASNGLIVGFLGSDDRLSENALELVHEFYEEHGDECDLVAIPIWMFGARSGPHWNNRDRFSTTRTIDVRDDWNSTQPHGGGTFIRKEALDENNLTFDPDLFISEDQTLNTQLIMRKMKYGVIADAKYFNRRHPVGGSLVSSGHFRDEFYTDVPKLAYQRMLDCGRELYGDVPLYAQAMVAYDLSWRFRADLTAMNPDLELQYRGKLRALLKQLDIQVIMAQRAPIEVRLSMLNIREDGELRERLSLHGLTYYLESSPVYSLAHKPLAAHKPARCDIEFFEVSGQSIEIQGTFRVPDIDDWDFSLEVGGRLYPVERLEDPRPLRSSYAREVDASVLFRVNVEMRPGEQLRPVVQVRDADETTIVVPVDIRMFRFSQFSGKAGVAYFRRDGRTVFRSRGRFALERRLFSVLGVIRAELGFLLRARRGGASTANLKNRLVTALRQTFTKKEIWLIGDHKSEAGDNGEAMFRYLCSRGNDGIEPTFVLRKDADAYDDLRRLGVVVEPNTKAHLQAYTDAAVVMNSAGDNYMLDPVGTSRRTYINDLIHHQSVFLQHGVTKDDQSAWLNRWSKGFDTFVTSAAGERDSILHDSYGYRPKDVVLTGMPRFDRLEDAPEKLVVFAPTWRKGLTGKLNVGTGRVGSSALFAQSEYSAFWQQVILHPRLNAAMRDAGYRGMFALHPSHAADASTFVPSNQIEVATYPHDYKEFFRRGSVLVTDYSSIAFDFAYLRKPVVYVQGDREEFFGAHLYSEGYFSYQRDGFGPVVESVDSLVDELVELFDKSSVMEPGYRERVDRFFAYSGGGNSERLRQAIVSRLNDDSRVGDV